MIPSLDDLRVKVEVKLEWKGCTIMDEEMASVLYEVRRRGSLLASCKALGVTYSSVWQKIYNVEKILGVKLVEQKRGGRGGGGARLTETANKLLNFYLQMSNSKKQRIKPELKGKATNSIIIAGSHDIALEKLVNILRQEKKHLDVETLWVGSVGGLASLMLGDSHVAGVHLIDPELGEYNIYQLRKYNLEDYGIVIRGYQREIGIASRKNRKITQISELLNNKVKIVNRNKGSGTRLLFDYLLRQEALKQGIPSSKVASMVAGYEHEVNTHLEVARAIAVGKAEAGLVIRSAAEAYGLEFTTVAWEWYDFVTTKQSYKLQQVRSFVETLTSKEFRNSIKSLKGYKISNETGEVIYSPPT